MNENEFIELIKQAFAEYYIDNLYKIELMKSGKIEIKYTCKEYGTHVICVDILERSK